MNTINTEEAGTISVGASHDVDFAVWILLHDGLHVPPFNKHSGGNKVLQSLGMTITDWYEWVKLIPISYDTHLYYNKEINDTEIEKAVSTKLASIIKAVTSMGIDPIKQYGNNWVEERRQEYFIEELQKYSNGKKAGLQYPDIDIKVVSKLEPPQLYPNSAIQTYLQELWAQYRFNDTKKHTDDCVINGKLDLYFQYKIDFFKIFLVDYPYSVELFVAPVFGLVSVPNKPVDYDSLQQRITNLITQNYHN